MPEKGQPLAPRQQEVWDMKRPISEGGQGKANPEIAAALGISVNVVAKYLTTVYKKLGIRGNEKAAKDRSLEHKDPEKTAAAIVAVTDPAYDKIKEAYAAAGIPAVGEAIIKRLRVKYSGLITETKNLQRKELSEMLGKRIHLALSYMDDKVMSEASFRDLALGTSAMVEKKNLVDGQPTQIISSHERAKLNELAPALLKEIQRRGLTLEGQVTEKTVEPA